MQTTYNETFRQLLSEFKLLEDLHFLIEIPTEVQIILDDQIVISELGVTLKSLKIKAVLKKEVEKLVHKLDKFTEDDLDKYVLPHPLLGKLTLREMLCFTIYHVRHHEEIVKRDLV